MNDTIETLSKILNINEEFIQLGLLVIIGLVVILFIALLFAMLLRTIRKPKVKEPKEPKAPKAEKVKVEKEKPVKEKKAKDKDKAKDKEKGQKSLFGKFKGKTSQEPPEQTDEMLSEAIDKLAANRGRTNTSKKKKPQKAKKPATKKATAKSVKRKAKRLQVPKTAQQTIPYQRVYPEEGIIETQDGVFTKSYLLDDVNYQVAKDEEQTDMFLKYCEFLNSFDPNTHFQITINQRNINMEEFEAETMLIMNDDGLDDLRIERNDLLKRKIKEGKNNMVKEKYLTVAVHAPDYSAARTIFARLDSEIATNIKKIGGAGATVFTTARRLELLHDIYNIGSEGMFGNNIIRDANGNFVFAKDKFSFEIMNRMGLTTKDMIAPESFSFRNDYGMMGDRYFRALFVRKIPTFLGDSVLKELTDTEFNMITSLTYQPIDGESALKMARAQIVNVNANVMDKQKNASRAGYSVDLINPTLKDAAEEAESLFKDLTGKNQKLFYMTLVIVHFAEDKETLDSNTKSIQAIGRKLLLDVKKLNWQQENGLDSVLPLCNNKLQIKRSLTTESAAVFMPFVNQELNDRDGGMYYGVNAVSHNLIMMNRRNSKNGNGMILGAPGTGKSMSAKQEMMTVLLSSDDDVIVIDPEGEYYPMAEMLGGEVIRIAPGEDAHINPFDLEMNVDSKDDPITLKSDFIGSICETIIGDRFGLTASMRSLIDRAVRKVYEPFLNSLNKETGEYDKKKLPTLRDFYNTIRGYNGYDAIQLADSLEMYVTGSQNLFAYQTNVEYSKRFVVYDIKDIGNNMKGLGLLVVLDNIWNRIVAGRAAGKHVWFYIDEIYLLFKNESSAEFLRNLYKRARKYGGIPTGITQNVSDLLEHPIARTIILNCEFIMMLSQSAVDRAQLGELLNISATQLSFITNASPGHGLIYDGVHMVPFINSLPKDTLEYEAMTTKLSEVKEREDRKHADEEDGAVVDEAAPTVDVQSDLSIQTHESTPSAAESPAVETSEPAQQD